MDIFSDEEAVTAQPEVIAEPEAAPQPEPADDGRPRDDKGRFAPKGEEQGASPAPVEKPEFDHAAVIGERKRRQEAESRLAALEAELQQLRNPPAPPPSIWEDEQGALQSVQQQAVSAASLNARLDTSEMLASQAHQDFDDKKAKFLEMASVNPALAQQALADRHPWEKAYQIAANAMKMEALGAVDLSDMEAKLREQIKAELAAQQAPAPALPNSLANAPAGLGGPAATGPQPFTLEDIIGR